MQGYKTLIAAAATAIVNLVVAFGIDISVEQKAAILGGINAVLLPIVMIVLRLMTKGPTPVADMLKMNTPWPVVILAFAMLGFLPGCALTSGGIERITAKISDQVAEGCALKDYEKQAMSAFVNGIAAESGRRIIICCADDSRQACNLPESAYTSRP